MNTFTTHFLQCIKMESSLPPSSNLPSNWRRAGAYLRDSAWDRQKRSPGRRGVCPPAGSASWHGDRRLPRCCPSSGPETGSAGFRVSGVPAPPSASDAWPHGRRAPRCSNESCSTSAAAGIHLCRKTLTSGGGTWERTRTPEPSEPRCWRLGRCGSCPSSLPLLKWGQSFWHRHTLPEWDWRQHWRRWKGEHCLLGLLSFFLAYHSVCSPFCWCSLCPVCTACGCPLQLCAAGAELGCRGPECYSVGAAGQPQGHKTHSSLHDRTCHREFAEQPEIKGQKIVASYSEQTSKRTGLENVFICQVCINYSTKHTMRLDFFLLFFCMRKLYYWTNPVKAYVMPDTHCIKTLKDSLHKSSKLLTKYMLWWLGFFPFLFCLIFMQPCLTIKCCCTNLLVGSCFQRDSLGHDGHTATLQWTCVAEWPWPHCHVWHFGWGGWWPSRSANMNSP